MRKGWKKGWKVVSPSPDGTLTSMCAARRSEYNPEYRAGMDTVPVANHGPLAVVRSLKAARKLLEDWPYPHEVWECVYLPTDPRDATRNCLWQPVGHGYSYLYPNEWPEGTVAAEIVRLTRRVSEGDKA